MESKYAPCGILRSDIELLRGDKLLLFDPGSDSYYHITEKTAKIIAFMTENMPAEDFLELLQHNGININMRELQEIILFLRSNNLLVPDYGEIPSKQQKIKKHKKNTGLLRFSSTYLFFKLPPWHPEKFFAAAGPYFSFFASKITIIILSIFALTGYILALRNAAEIKTAFLNTLSWGGLVKYFAAIIFIKILHEAAHSISAVHFKCRVRGIGIGFMMFMPRLYTDTTDSYRLKRSERLLIDAAGLIAELLIGGIAALLWSNLAPGAAKSTMFYIFAVSTVSTLFVNGNPFIRYDGYYILSDILGIENLMGQSSECLCKFRRYFFLRIGDLPHEKNRIFLLFFGIGAFIYKIFLYTSICLIIYHKFTKFLAIIMLVLEIYAILIYPCITELRIIKTLSSRSSKKAFYFMLAAGILLVSAILFIPVSWGIKIYGESISSSRIPVTLKESGYLLHDMPHTAQFVRAGEKILSLSSPRLATGINKLKKMIAYDRLQYELQSIDSEEFSLKNVTAQKIASDKIALNELERRTKSLNIIAPAEGIFVPTYRALYSGAFIPGNTVIGEISSGDIIICAYANDREISKLSPGITGKAYLQDSLSPFRVKVIRVETIAAAFKASSLLQPYGGPLAVYHGPDNNLKSSQTLYRVDLEILDENKPIPGRVLQVNLESTQQLYKKILPFIISFFHRNF